MQKTSYLLIPLLLFFMACSPSDDSKSSIKIITPSKQDLKSKVGSLNAFPSNYKYCYGVNIMASDLISSPQNTCSPAQGLFKGYVAAGSEIELIAPRGDDRDIFVYLHLIPLDQSCALSNGLNNGELNQVYKIGEALDIDFDAPEISVTIQASFPGTTNHLASTISAPTSCYINDTSNGFELASGGGDTSSTTYKIRTKIGTISSGDDLIGTNYKIKGH